MGSKITGIDRISQMSDDVLARILSLLPSKLAGSTMVLSSRWKHVFWSHISRININISSTNNNNTELAIQLFEAVFKCKQLISGRIITNYFHLPDSVDMPRLKHLHIEMRKREDVDSLSTNLKHLRMDVREDADSLSRNFNRFVEWKKRGVAEAERFGVFLSGDLSMVLKNEGISEEEYMLEIETLRSLVRSDGAKRKRPVDVYVGHGRWLKYED